jgi:hypothetical protein
VNWTPTFHLRRGAPAALVATLALTCVVGLTGAAGLPIPVGSSTTAPPAPGSAPAVPVTPPPTTPLTDQTPAPAEPPAPDPSPHIRVLLARLAVLDAQHALTAQQQATTAAHDALTAADAVLDQAVQARQAAGDALEDARQQLGATAAYAYMHAGGGDFVSVLRGDSTAGGSERELFAASVDHHQQVVVEAQATRDAADTAVADARQADDDARQAATDQDTLLEAASTGLADAHHEQATAAAEESRPPTPDSWQLSIQGPSVFTADELAAWYEAQGHGSKASVPMADLAHAFIDQGNAEGIRGDMAFAQSIHETGWFANLDTIDANNFAGIGHCSDCPGGFPFDSAQVGALAQLQLLKSYVERDPTYVLPRADPKLNGPAGCCQTWTELGGVWASDPNYGPHILARYADMLEWLVVTRTAAG